MKSKILFNCLTYDNGNLVSLLLKLNIWSKKNIDLTILLTPFLKNRLEKEKLPSNLKYILFNTDHQLSNQKLAFMLDCLIRNIRALHLIPKLKHKFDIIFTNSSVLDTIILPSILKLHDRHLKWATIFDNAVPLFDAGNIVIKILSWTFFQISLIFLRQADLLFAPNTLLVKFLTDRGFAGHKAVFIPNGIQSELILKAKILKKYRYDALFVGRINETKGIYDMLKVLQIVVKTFPDFKLAIMGSGDNRTENQFKTEINNKHLTQNVIFLGYVTGQLKFDIIKSCQCLWFLSTSASESFGVALLEAVCSQKPAFTYNLPPFKEIYLQHEITISPLYDYQSVAKKVIDLFTTKQFNNQKGKLLIKKYDSTRLLRSTIQKILTSFAVHPPSL